MLSIIIPVYNQWNYTKSCLSDLSALTDCEIIVVNNGSTDGTAISFEEMSSSNMYIINLFENTGFAHACNKGFLQSTGDYVLFLNNDIRVRNHHATWVDDLIKESDEDCLVGPTGGILDDDLNFIKETNKIFDKNFYMSGWCLLATKKTYNKLTLAGYDGPFTEEFTTYFEDTDLSFRAKEMGMTFKIVDVPVTHFGKVTSRSKLSELYLPAKRKFIDKWKSRL